MDPPVQCNNTHLCFALPPRVFCEHQDWVEGVLVCQAKDNAYDQSFFSYSADGHVCCWELDAEQNCDIFRVMVGDQHAQGP